MSLDPRPVYAAATVSYLANCLVGVGVATGTIDTSRHRWVHHALYIATSVLCGAAALSALAARRPAALAILPAAVPLAVIPRVSARTRAHPAIALSAAPFIAAGTVGAWR